MRICVMGGASARQLKSRCKMYSCFCKSTKMYIQLRVPTYNHNYFVLHCCFGFSASARNDVTARASSWLVNGARISAKVQIFQLVLSARMARQTLNSRRAASFVRIAPQDCLSRLCIDLTCKGAFTPDATCVNELCYSRVVGRLNILSLLVSFTWNSLRNRRKFVSWEGLMQQLPCCCFHSLQGCPTWWLQSWTA